MILKMHNSRKLARVSSPPPASNLKKTSENLYMRASRNPNSRISNLLGTFKANFLKPWNIQASTTPETCQKAISRARKSKECHLRSQKRELWTLLSRLSNTASAPSPTSKSLWSSRKQIGLRIVESGTSISAPTLSPTEHLRTERPQTKKKNGITIWILGFRIRTAQRSKSSAADTIENRPWKWWQSTKGLIWASLRVRNNTAISTTSKKWVVNNNKIMRRNTECTAPASTTVPPIKNLVKSHSTFLPLIGANCHRLWITDHLKYLRISTQNTNPKHSL